MKVSKAIEMLSELNADDDIALSWWGVSYSQRTTTNPYQKRNGVMRLMSLTTQVGTSL